VNIVLNGPVLGKSNRKFHQDAWMRFVTELIEEIHHNVFQEEFKSSLIGFKC